jgi:hypothetical protein
MALPQFKIVHRKRCGVLFRKPLLAIVSRGAAARGHRGRKAKLQRDPPVEPFDRSVYRMIGLQSEPGSNAPGAGSDASLWLRPVLGPPDVQPHTLPTEEANRHMDFNVLAVVWPAI